MRSRRKEKKKKNIYLILYTIINIAFIVFLKVINILPTLYFLIAMGGIILLYVISFILIRKKKKIGYILSVLFTIIYIVISYYLGITMNFFSSFDKIKYNEETYLVLVLKEKGYKKIEDINNSDIGYYENNLNNIDKAIEKLDKKITTNKSKYEDYNKLFSDLDNKNIEGIVIDENYYNIKNEEDSTDDYQILYKITVRSLVKEVNKTVDVTNTPFTIYISGIDVYGDIETVSRSDVNILMTVNPKTKQILLTSIPRDYYVRLHGTSGYKDKLTHAGNYGVNMSIDTIEDLMDIDINYYVRVNFTTLEKLIDAIGGVDVYSKYSFVSYIDSYQFYKGYNHMNGKQALAFSRERKSLPAGDGDRGRNQEAVIEGIIRKVTSKNVIYKYSKILGTMKGTFQTNLSDSDMSKLIKKELENIGGWTVTSNSLEGTGASEYTYSYSGQKLYVTIPDETSITNGKDLIDRVIKGEKLESSYSNPSNIVNPDKVTPKVEETPKEDNTKKEEPKKEDTKKDDKKEEVKDNTDTKKDKEPLDDLLPDNKDKDNTNTDNTTTDDSNINKDDTTKEDNTNNDNKEINDLLPSNNEGSNSTN